MQSVISWLAFFPASGADPAYGVCGPVAIGVPDWPHGPGNAQVAFEATCSSDEVALPAIELAINYSVW